MAVILNRKPSPAPVEEGVKTTYQEASPEAIPFVAAFDLLELREDLTAKDPGLIAEIAGAILDYLDPAVSEANSSWTKAGRIAQLRGAGHE